MEDNEITAQALDAPDDIEKLIEIWKVLEVLTVSMDRIGMYWHFNGREAAKESLIQYMGPSMNKKIGHARSLIRAILQARDPKIRERLESLAEDEGELGYWDGPR